VAQCNAYSVCTVKLAKPGGWAALMGQYVCEPEARQHQLWLCLHASGSTGRPVPCVSRGLVPRCLQT
jgi:hypothetical protein